MSAPFEDDGPALADDDADLLDKLSDGWASWIRTRRFYAPPSMPPSVLGRLRSPSEGGTGPNAVSSAELAAWNRAIEAQPLDALDRRVFELHYRHRVKPVKTFAAALGISRQHWYVLLRSFQRRVAAAAREIRAEDEAARRSLPHGGDRRRAGDRLTEG